MTSEQILTRNGNCYDYPWSTHGLYKFVYIPLLTGVLCFSVYLLIADSPKFIPHGLVMSGVILLVGFLLFEVILIYLHLGTIVVNDREIKSIVRGGPVTILWKEIDQIYCTIHPGNNIPNPYFSVCILSKKNLIMFERGIVGITELMDTIRQYTDVSRPKEISFSEFTRLLLRHSRR